MLPAAWALSSKPRRNSPALFFVIILIASTLLLAPKARPANRNWQNTGTDWNTGTSWSGNQVPVAGDTATFQVAKVTNPNLSASDTISILNFSTAASAGYDITSSNTGIKLTLTSTGTTTSSAINAANTSGTNIIDVPIVLGAAAASTQTFTQASGGTLIVNGVISSTNTLTLSLAGGGNVQFSGANTYAGATTVSAGVLNIRNNTALGTTANGTSVTGGAALELQGTIAVGAEALTLNGTGISSGGALRNISGDNSYAGPITLGSATRINSDSGTLTLDVVSGNAITGTQNLTFGGAGNVTVNDSIATSTGTLTKDGAGTLTLAGTNTYTGATSITAGILLVNGSTASGSAVTVSNSGTVLGGTGTMGGTVNVNAGAIINPGPKGTDGTSGSVGTLTISNATTGALTLASTATFHGDAFGTATSAWDKLVVNGTANLGSSTLQIIIASGLTFNPGDIYTLIDANVLSGTFNGIADDQLVTFSGYQFIADYDLVNGNFDLVAVPEPSTWLAAGLALGAIGFSQRRRLRACAGPLSVLGYRHSGSVGNSSDPSHPRSESSLNF